MDNLSSMRDMPHKVMDNAVGLSAGSNAQAMFASQIAGSNVVGNHPYISYSTRTSYGTFVRHIPFLLFIEQEICATPRSSSTRANT